VHDAHRNGRGRQREVEKEFCERHRHDQQRVLGPPSAVESTVVFYLVHVHVVALARMMQGTLALHLLSIVGVALLLDDHEDALVAVLHHEEAHGRREREEREEEEEEDAGETRGRGWESEPLFFFFFLFFLLLCLS